MSLTGDMFADVQDLLDEAFGTVAVAYAQGANTKASVPMVDMGLARLPGERGQDLEARRYEVDSAELATGFSSSNPVTPAPGDTLTIGGVAWKVAQDGVRSVGRTQGTNSAYVLTASRRVARGAV